MNDELTVELREASAKSRICGCRDQTNAQLVIRFECNFSLLGKISVLNSLFVKKKAIIRYTVTTHLGPIITLISILAVGE